MHEDTVKSKVKDPSEVFWRWFYVSNWGNLNKCSRSTHREEIRRVIGYYNAAFAQKATIEIIDGCVVKAIPASDFLKDAE